MDIVEGESFRLYEGVVFDFKWTVFSCVYCETIIIVTQVDIRFLLTTNVFVAFITNILADQNVMSCAGGDLTFHLCNNTLAGLSLWNINLNGIINQLETPH